MKRKKKKNSKRNKKKNKITKKRNKKELEVILKTLKNQFTFFLISIIFLPIIKKFNFQVEFLKKN